MKKIKFSNISTKNETQNQPSKSKRKILKACGFGSLAVMMAVAGTFAFAPLGATPNNLTNASELQTTSGLGLDPKNDPVVYTTESGLEIKMSNATKYTGTTTTTTNNGNSFSQDLTSFYYFTMGTYSGTIYTGKNLTDTYTVTNEPVNWIILGLGANTNYFVDHVSSYLYSTWKTNSTAQYSNESNGTYFFDNISETSSPAGSAINSVVPSKSYIVDKVKASITTNSEIPAGCMLVISEKLLNRSYFNSTGAVNKSIYTEHTTLGNVLMATGIYGNRYRYFGNVNTPDNTSTANLQTWTISGNAGGSLYNFINNLFSKNNSTNTILKNSLSFTQKQADLIIPQQLYTYYSNGTNYNHAETPSTDSGTYYTMFPLAYRTAHSATKQNFCIEDYLPNQNQRVASLIGSNQADYWSTRSADPASTSRICRINPNGTFNTNCNAFDVIGVRPAMVMKLK